MKALRASLRSIALGFGILGFLAAHVFAYYSDTVSAPSGPVYSSSTVYSVPSGTTVEWFNSGWGGNSCQVSINGGGLNVYDSGPNIFGYDVTSQAGNIDYTIYAYVNGDGASQLSVYFEW